MVSQQLADQIIQTDTSHLRFEKFCTALMSVVEGRDFVPTSTSWDRGRDARAVGASRGSHAGLICCTLDEDIDAKVSRDLARLAATSEPDRVIYCSSRNLSEHRLDKLAAEVRTILGAHVSVTVYASLQLAALSEQHSESFETHYQAELRNVYQALAEAAAPVQEPTTRGLRLALLTYASDDAASLRRALLLRCALEALDSKQPRTVGAVAKRVSDGLHLTRGLNVNAVSQALSDLEDLKQAFVNDAGGWSLTEHGEAELGRTDPDAARVLLEGKALIKAKLLELTGYNLADDHLDRIWSTLLDFLADLFYSNGLGLIGAISTLLDEGVSAAENGNNLREILRTGAAKVRATTTALELGEALEQAVIDLFVDRDGPAFEWLARVAERFVATCSLGLEWSSSGEVRAALLNQTLVLDSDIVLSFLCAGEQEHQAVRELVVGWRRMGGKILVVTPVLLEVAHHAWISERDFEEMRFLAGKLKGAEVRHYASNAFVRAFFTLAHSKSDVRRWNAFIGQYKGSAPDDYGSILEILKEDLGVERLPDAFDDRLRSEIGRTLISSVAAAQGRSEQELDARTRDKANRDAQLLATIAAARQSRREAGDSRTVVLISSSGRLRRVVQQFEELAKPPSVMSRAGFAYLMTLVPDGVLGPGSFRKLLFDFGHESTSLTDSERIALRVIKATGTIDVPWARRRTLRRQLETAIHDEAAKLGVRDKVVLEQFERADDAVRPAELIADALKGMAMSDVVSEELRATRGQLASRVREVEELQREIRELRSARRRGAES